MMPSVRLIDVNIEACATSQHDPIVWQQRACRDEGALGAAIVAAGCLQLCEIQKCERICRVHPQDRSQLPNPRLQSLGCRIKALLVYGLLSLKSVLDKIR